MDYQVLLLGIMYFIRACAQIAFCKMCDPLCGGFDINLVCVVSYSAKFILNSTAKWDAHLAGMNLGTRSRVIIE